MRYVFESGYYNENLVNKITRKVIYINHNVSIKKSEVNKMKFIEKDIVALLLPYIRWKKTNKNQFACNCEKTAEYLAYICKIWSKYNYKHMTDEEIIRFYTGYIFRCKDSDFVTCKYTNFILDKKEDPNLYEMYLSDSRISKSAFNYICENIQKRIVTLYRCYSSEYRSFPKYNDNLFNIKTITDMCRYQIIPKKYIIYFEENDFNNSEMLDMLDIIATEYFMEVYSKFFTTIKISKYSVLNVTTKRMYYSLPTPLKLKYKDRSIADSIIKFKTTTLNSIYDRYDRYFKPTLSHITIDNRDNNELYTIILNSAQNKNTLPSSICCDYINEMVFKVIRNKVIAATVENSSGIYGVNPDIFTFKDSLEYTNDPIDAPNKSILGREIRSKIREMLSANYDFPYESMTEVLYKTIKWKNLKYDKDGNIIMTQELSDQCSLVAYKVISKYADKLTGMTIAYDPYTGKKWTKIIPIIE